ncbi:SurA N-terminal domain-containing protein [Salinicoccus sesuvii]|uniref:peptidylprolyl isomerase n=1 Tax=Salinicoccus sesuvii TaxID=868281 RepID=A0ABV7NAA6_9STAP
MKKWLLGLSLSAFAVVMVACGDDDSANNTNEETQNQEDVATGDSEGASDQQMEMPEPDLEDVPDVVAEVNGQEINKDEFEQVYVPQFQQVAMKAQMAGEEVNQAQVKEQVADGLVSQELLRQEAENRGIETSDEEVDAVIDDLVEQNGLESRDELFAALEEQGLTEEEVRMQLSDGLSQDKLLDEEIGEIEVTEEELQSVYDDAVAEQEETGGEQELPPFEEVEDNLEANVREQKANEATRNYADELRENADVTINL